MDKEINYLGNFCKDFCDILDRYAKYIVISGFFVISSGRSRSTEDIDLIIEQINIEQFKKLHKDLTENKFECLQSSNPVEIHNYLMNNIAVRYVRDNIYIPNIELKFPKDFLDKYQLKTRKKIDFTDIDVFFGSIEACIAFKEELLRSPKDLKDARHLRIVYSEEIKEDEIDNVKTLIRKYRL